jgi:4-diphosphocytidyl-2-C-methyl-D-erythritol kinase
MIFFPNAKVNVGLHVIGKRQDGFHDIETIFLPIALCDMLEFIPDNALNEQFKLTTTGIPVKSDDKDNICVKAYLLLQKKHNLPPIRIHLHKRIPIGAGLGGGSSDAAFMLKKINAFFNLKMSDDQLRQHASELGSDCSFFIDNKPAIATGKGNVLSNVAMDLKGLYVLLIYPDIHVSTKEAYKGLTIENRDISLAELTDKPVRQWKTIATNDFEKSIFTKYPQIKEIKDQMYINGALYASMSGSGSSVFGLYKHIPDTAQYDNNYFVWTSKL